MGSVTGLMLQLGRTVSGHSGDQSAIGSRNRDALLRWESEGGARAAVRDEDIDAVRKSGEGERADPDEVATIDEDAIGAAAALGEAKDAEADVAGNPAEQGRQG